MFEILKFKAFCNWSNWIWSNKECNYAVSIHLVLNKLEVFFYTILEPSISTVVAIHQETDFW